MTILSSDGVSEPTDPIRLGVKELAQFVHRHGDIHYRYEYSALAQEGIARQRDYQRDRAPSYQSEVSVKASFGALIVSGRIDGWDPAAALVEEIKTTRADARELHARIGSVNAAQLKLYGAMLVLADPTLGPLRLRLVYLHPDKPTETVFEECLSRRELLGFFETTCATYARWIASTDARLGRRNERLRAASFPHDEFRDGQRRLAKALFRGFRDAADWLVEAPTGSGKTIASVFPACKAMGEGHLDRVVFLTSRTTGQRAAEAAFRDAAGDAAVAVTITAKDRICFNPGMPCDPERCEFASGYYDRMPAAREALLGGGVADRSVVERVAREHRVCPFELSLDAAAWADAVIGDYNYVFDPVIRFKRLDNERFRRIGLVVDEAHQLGDRVRDMLGMRLSRFVVKAAIAEPGLAPGLAKGLRSVDRALAKLDKTSREAAEGRDGEREVTWPEGLVRAIDRFLVAFAETPVEADDLPAVSEAHFDLLRFRRACEWAEEGTFHCLGHHSGRRFQVEIACTVPGRYIQEILAPFHGSARLSGTLTPAGVFQRIHGFAQESDSLSTNGLAFSEQLDVLLVPDLSTFYRDRQRTMPDLVRLIDGVRGTTPGNILVAFPSFAYARAAAAVFDHPALRCQEPDMTLADREDFIAWVNTDGGPDGGRVAFVVMGGVFAESVDYDSSAVRGIVVVGVGLPPRSLRRDFIAVDSVANDIAEDGFEIAYRQPAMTRVVQAVGRVARGDHRGIAVLVDPRFRDPAYQAFMPNWWKPRCLPARAAAGEVADFWGG
ncbi:MAG: hypothetical protein OXH15_20075 [Gammaproteobacteria bacterium]|nr:hypothetical protein [Gammaproteobacteria bacterium]